ncbi:MAG: YgfZ/GcvT domain-containing protein [Acidimicrobiia bacterium]
MTDTTDAAAGYQALVEGAGLVDGSDRGSVLVTGPDARSFLHSLLSQDVAGLGPGEGAHALLLQPQGKLDCDLRLLVIGPEEVRLDCDPGRGAPLAASLCRFKLRVKADVADTTGSWGTLILRGPRALEVAEAAAGVSVPGTRHQHVAWPGGGLRLVRADWPGGWLGVDVVGPAEGLGRAGDALVAAGAVRAGSGAYEAARVLAGVPRQGVDIDERTIPQEAFLEQDAVSFTKGCFLGQELVCRIDTRGHVNRYLRAFSLPDDTTPPPGAGIVVGDKEVGILTTVARSAAGTRALGYLRREVEVPAQVLVRWEGGEVTARADALPEWQ